MNSISEFFNKFEEYLKNHWAHLFHAYVRNHEHGAFLIKNLTNSEITIFKFYNTERNLGFTKIQNSIDKTSTFKGHKIDSYVYFGQNFRDNSKRSPNLYPNLTIIEVDLPSKKISIFGSSNIDKILLMILIDFSDSLGYEIDYDYRGVLKYVGKKNGIPQIKTIETSMKNPSVFFSYSWDNETHKLWVLKLAADLMRNGVKVIIDEWDLKNYKDDMHLFMESGIRDSERVIIICTPNYAKKSNVRKGGVGIENTIISGEYYDEKTSSKYIPIIRGNTTDIKDNLPTYLKVKYAIDFREDSQYNKKFDELLRKILDIPKYKRPELGPVPTLETREI